LQEWRNVGPAPLSTDVLFAILRTSSVCMLLFCTYRYFILDWTRLLQS